MKILQMIGYIFKNKLSILFFSVVMLAICVPLTSFAQQSSQVDHSGLAELIERAGRSPSDKNIRALAVALENNGLYHMSLIPWAQLAQRRGAGSEGADRLGLWMAWLGHFEMAQQVSRGLRGRQARGLRLALAGAALESGQVARARSLMPNVGELRGIPMIKIRNKALYWHATLELQRGQVASALNLFASIGPDTKNEFHAPGLVRLQRARLLYERGQFQESLEEASNILRDDIAWHQGLLTSSWTAFRLGDFNLALGQLMTLRSPYLIFKYAPEVHILEAATLYELCYFESAMRSVNELESRYEGFVQSVGQFRRQIGSGLRSTEQVLAFAAGNQSMVDGLSKHHGPVIMDGILSADQFLILSQSLAQADFESNVMSELQSHVSENRFTRPFLRSGQQRLLAARRDYLRQGSAVITKRLRSMESEVQRSLEQAMAVKVEINFRIRDRLMQRSVPRLAQIEFDAEVAKGYEFWPFEGEFWRDELGGYFFVTADACEGSR